MSSINIVRQSDIVRTPRVMQLEGIFDVPPSERSAEQWTVNLDLPAEWNIGLIVGPSGSGKTTIARELFGDYMISGFEWSHDKSIVDDFPRDMSIKDITDLLSSVGFSSPPSWVRPFHVLSNGEQFRVNMARTLAENKELAVMDEFTSVVDRTVAQIGSAAIAKTVRRRKQRFIAVSCHYDIAEWLEPDWIYQPATNEFASGRYLQRPEISLTVKRVHSDAWQLFRKHHYLNMELHKASRCFVAFWNDTPVAFTAVLHFPHPKDPRMKREHRTVCLPDFQGVGIGNAMSAYIGSVVKGIGFRFFSITSHPAMIRARAKSALWKMTKAPSYQAWDMAARRHAALVKWSSRKRERITSSFEYIGAALPKDEAAHVWNGT
jgi:ABC-type molybdenum transport system ATPase subunit/photorepair protein PhrA